MADEAKLAQLLASLPNAGRPLPGVITAGMPSAEHFGQLAAAGCQTVLDVSAPEEPRGFDEAALVATTGMNYVNLPVRSYQPDDTLFDQARVLLRESSHHPLLFHCRSANRVGGLLLPYLMLDEGKSQDEAIEIAVQVGLRSPELAQTALAYVERQQGARDKSPVQ